jgi:hypothetical protein
MIAATLAGSMAPSRSISLDHHRVAGDQQGTVRQNEAADDEQPPMAGQG